MTDPYTSHPLYRGFAEGQPIGADDPFGFACRGCGHLCCAEKTVLVMPPEAVRIHWHIARRDLGIAHWGALFLGGSSGLPVMALRFDHPGRRCVFSRTVRVHGRALGALCLLREARPGPCRTYPLGRAFTLEPATGVTTTEYRVTHLCPGFDPASPEGLPDLQRPAPAGQTVASWLAGQLDPDQEAEKVHYLSSVVPAFMQARLHAPTEDQPAGRLPEALALRVLGPLLYPELPMPADPKDDHAAVIAWLQLLPALAHKLAAALPEEPHDRCDPTTTH